MNRAVYDICPFDLEEAGPFSIFQQFRSIHHPESRAAERLKLFYGASNYLSRWHPKAYGWNGWTENFKAAEELCHRFRLHTREAFQLLRFEFNPRCCPRLSDSDLWKVILVWAEADCSSCNRESDWLKESQIQPSGPRAAHWMAGRSGVMFWVHDPEIGNRWIKEVARRESSKVTEFASRVLSLRSWQEHEDTRKGPPLQDHPLLGHEIAAALGISHSEVQDVLARLIGRNHIVKMDLKHVPGIYSEVFVPNCFGEGNA